VQKRATSIRARSGRRICKAVRGENEALNDESELVSVSLAESQKFVDSRCRKERMSRKKIWNCTEFPADVQ
jgi:hypothetical protein